MLTPISRFDELTSTLKTFAAPAEIEPLAFGNVCDKLGTDAYAFTATLAVLPFLQPIRLRFFALIVSAFIALGLQLFKGQAHLVLPQKNSQRNA